MDDGDGEGLEWVESLERESNMVRVWNEERKLEDT